MANICSINIHLPLNDIPDEKEREQLKALHEAEKKWGEAVKKNDELHRGKNRDVFLTSQPDVPFKRTDFRYSHWDKEVKSGKAKNGDLKPDSEQWNEPTIYATFYEKDNEIWVFPYSFGRGRGLLFDEDDGITVSIKKFPKNKMVLGSFCRVPVSWDFKWGFPWWAEIGFAGGKKQYAEGEDAPSGLSEEFYNKWCEEHGQAFPYLVWEHSVSEIVKNLEYAIQVYENFPVSGLTWQMSWVWRELQQLKEIYRWIKKLSLISSKAIAHLDWGEVASNSGEFEWTKKNDSPNQLMSNVKRLETNIKKLNEEKLSLGKFMKKYASHLRKTKKDDRGYIPIIKRDPFYWIDWL